MYIRMYVHGREIVIGPMYMYVYTYVLVSRANPLSRLVAMYVHAYYLGYISLPCVRTYVHAYVQYIPLPCTYIYTCVYYTYSHIIHYYLGYISLLCVRTYVHTYYEHKLLFGVYFSTMYVRTYSCSWFRANCGIHIASSPGLPLFAREHIIKS